MDDRSGPAPVDVAAVAQESGPLRWLLTGASPSGDAASAIYGTILAASLLIAIDGGPMQIVLGMVATAVVFWLAHAHVGLIRGVVREQHHVTARDVRATLRQEWPLAQASLSPAAPMLLAWLGLIGVDTARSLGVAICMLGLLAWGIVISRAAGLGRRGTLLTIGINLGLGLVLVVLKYLVH